MRFSIAAVAVFLVFASEATAQRQFMRVEDVRPGMKGIGRTVFQGTKPEEFQVEILGVMKGIGPGLDAVLARFSGGPLAQTGVFEGMSGSPVFIDGKILGAVAFSFAFAKEAIGGITPITQMVDAFSETEGGTAGPRILLKRSLLWNYLLKKPSDAESLAGLFGSPLDTMLSPVLPASSAHSLIPIATPLNLAGFKRQTLEVFGPQFRTMGFSVLQGTGSSGLQAKPAAKRGPSDEPPLEPGSNIVVPLVRGDLDASAGGTVTWIDGDRIYAFGHQFFNLGFTELPMHKGRAITVFPSQQSSFKILEMAEPAGVIRQDRASGIYGVIGTQPRMIPLRVSMSTSRGVKRELKYELARDRFLTPFLVNLAVFNSIVSSDRSLGVSTVEVKGKIALKGHEAVEIENRFSEDSNAPAFASLSVALPVNFLLAFGYKDLEFERIDLEITALEDDRAALLHEVRCDRTELRAGETLNMTLSYERTDGEVSREIYPVKIPSDITPGPLVVLVADGTNIMQMDAREQGDELVPRDLSQLIRFMNNIRKNHRLYLRMYRREPGAVVRGEGLPGLPPATLSILRSDRAAGGLSSIQTAGLMEYELPPSDYVVTGSRTLQLVIKP
jgi:hypothetical protein